MTKIDVFGGPSVAVNDDVLPMLEDRLVLWLAGRVGVLIDNRFIDLAAWRGGLGAKTGDDPTDYRTSNIFVPTVTLNEAGESPVLAWNDQPMQERPLTPLPQDSLAVDTGNSLALQEGGIKYVDYERSRTMPNIAVDSIANEGTLLTLSHWPNNDTPKALRTDLSAKSVFAYFDGRNLVDSDWVVTTEHFDLDGLVSAYTFMNFDRASANRALMIEIASYGDFRKTHDENAVKIAMALEAINNPEKGLLDPAVYQQASKRRCHEKFKRGLLLLDEILAAPSVDAFRALWHDDFERYRRTQQMFQDGKVTLAEDHAKDLAFFEIERSMWDARQIEDDRIETYLGFSTPSFHNRTDCKNVLLYCNGHFELHQRYEGWVDRAGAVDVHRQDLAALGDLLNRIEATDQGLWHYHGVVEIMPCLYSTGTSSIAKDRLYRIVATYLTECPPGWVPA